MESGEQEGRGGFLDDADRIFGDDSRSVEPIFGDDESLEMEPFSPGPPPPPEPHQRRRRRGPSGETIKRILVAVPWIVFAIVITALGGPVFMGAMVLLGIVGLREYFLMAHSMRPVNAAGYLAVPALIIAAHFGTSFQVLLVAAASFPVLFLFAANRERRDRVTVSMAVTLLGIIWIGLPLVH